MRAPISVRGAAAVGSMMLLAACASQGGAPPSRIGGGSGGGGGAAAGGATVAFKASDFAWSKAAGKGRIDGELAYGGQTYRCTNASIILTPETPWVRRRMQILYNSEREATLPADEVRGRTPPERSQDYSNFVRRTTCDAAGRFSFSGLPDGGWFVITVARPRTAGAGRDMAIMRHVTIRNGEAVRVRL